jgi:hypothetical protein
MESSSEALKTWNRIKQETSKNKGIPEDLINEFIKLESSDRVSLFQKAFHNSDRNLGLMLLKYLDQEELISLFSDLIYLSSFAHGGLVYMRDVIKTLPKEWVVDNIEEVAEKYLLNGDYETYRCLLGLFFEVDKGITLRLAMKAASSTDINVREAGEDFLLKR